MNDIQVFAEYAAAFEVAVLNDEWQHVRKYFADEAVYDVAAGPPFGGTWKGGDAIVDHLVESLNTFDRTYDERLLEPLSVPEMRNGAVYIRWVATYRKQGQPDLRVEGEEEVWIEDGKIVRLKDTIPA